MLFDGFSVSTIQLSLLSDVIWWFFGFTIQLSLLSDVIRWFFSFYYSIVIVIWCYLMIFQFLLFNCHCYLMLFDGFSVATIQLSLLSDVIWWFFGCYYSIVIVIWCYLMVFRLPHWFFCFVALGSSVRIILCQCVKCTKCDNNKDWLIDWLKVQASEGQCRVLIFS